MYLITFLVSCFFYKCFKGRLKILPLLIFTFFVGLFREVDAGADAKFYIDYLYTGQIQWTVDREPMFTWLADTVRYFAPETKPEIIFRLITLCPAILVSLTSYFINLPILMLFYSAFEGFVLLSFNGIRQGLAEAFLVCSSLLYLSLVLDSSHHSLFKLGNIVSYINKFPIKFTLVIITLIFSIISHISSLLYICLFFLSSQIIEYQSNILLLLSKIRLNKSLFSPIALVLVATALAFLFSDFSNDIVNALINKFVGYSIANKGFNSGPFGAIYRISILFIWTLYSAKRLISNQQVTIKGSLRKNINLNIIMTSILTFLITTPLAFFALGIFVRFSYYTYISIGLVALSLSDYLQNNVSNQSKYNVYFLLCLFVGIVSYNSSAVLKQL